MSNFERNIYYCESCGLGTCSISTTINLGEASSILKPASCMFGFDDPKWFQNS